MGCNFDAKRRKNEANKVGGSKKNSHFFFLGKSEKAIRGIFIFEFFFFRIVET